MEPIIQINQKEYNELVNRANLNDKKIKSLAEKMYKEKGTYMLKVESEIRTKECGDTYFHTNVWDITDTDKLTFGDKKRIMIMVDKYIESWFDFKYYGFTNAISEYKKAKENEEKWLRNAKLLTYTGWVMAAMILVFALMK